MVKVNSILDFLGLIAQLCRNGNDNFRVFISEGQAYKTFTSVGESSLSTSKTHFSFLLMSDIYQVFFSDTVNNDEYKTIKSQLVDYQDQENHSFYITQFENIEIKNGFVVIENELEVI